MARKGSGISGGWNHTWFGNGDESSLHSLPVLFGPASSWGWGVFSIRGLDRKVRSTDLFSHFGWKIPAISWFFRYVCVLFFFVFSGHSSTWISELLQSWKIITWSDLHYFGSLFTSGPHKWPLGRPWRYVCGASLSERIVSQPPICRDCCSWFVTGGYFRTKLVMQKNTRAAQISWVRGERCGKNGGYHDRQSPYISLHRLWCNLFCCPPFKARHEQWKKPGYLGVI